MLDFLDAPVPYIVSVNDLCSNVMLHFRNTQNKIKNGMKSVNACKIGFLESPSSFVQLHSVGKFQGLHDGDEFIGASTLVVFINFVFSTISGL